MTPVFAENAPRANWVHNRLESIGDMTAMIPFRRVSLFSAALLVAASCTVHAAGGPDAFGYTWKANTDPGGPPLEWLDISSVGTLVTGLTDDNASTAITLPQPFRYYWTDVSQIVVGSNGWISMQPASNIASCFPTIPTAGGATDSYIAPFMSDLIFTGAGNTGSARVYFDAPGNLYIISYLGVPYWIVGAPGYTGSTTFQLVLDYNDRSIRFNYQSLTPFPDNAGCNSDLVIGIESPNGTIGLQPLLETRPGTPGTIRFDYPDTPLISVIDPSPNQLLNATSAGVFVHVGTPMTLTGAVENSGTATTTSAVDARGEVLQPGPAGTVVYDQTVSIPSIDANAQVPVTFTPDYSPAAGPQVLRVSVSGGGDINPGNNQVVSEIRGLIPNGVGQIVGYTDATAATGSLNWNGGSGQFDFGAAVLIILPDGGYSVTALQAFIAANAGSDSVGLELRDNDGPNGMPGTSLGLVDVPGASVTTQAWNTFQLPHPVAVDADGFYLVWYQRGQAFLGTAGSEPVSRRGLELLSGSFSAYRSNDTFDLMLRVIANSNDLIFYNGFE
jgi:hypothetical protein